MDICANKCAAFKIARRLATSRRAGEGGRIAAFLAALHRAPPEIAKRGVSRGQRIEVIALGEGKCAIIAEPFDVGLYPHLGIIGWALGSAVKINIELDLQSPNIFVQMCELLLDSQLFFKDQSPALVAVLARPSLSSKFVVADSQGVIS